MMKFSAIHLLVKKQGKKSIMSLSADSEPVGFQNETDETLSRDSSLCETLMDKYQQ